MNADPRRWPRRLLITFVVLIAFYAGYRYTLHRFVRAKLAEVRRQGYPVTLAELDAWYPTPPPGQNAAEIYEDAFKKYASWKWDQLQLVPIAGYAETPQRSAPLQSDMRNAIASYLADNQEALRLLHAGATRKHCRYPVSYSGGLQTPLPQLSGVRHGARLLWLEAALAADEGDAQTAASSVIAGVALTDSLAAEPDGISLLVRAATLRMQVSSLEYSLSRTSFTAAQLTELGAAFAASEITNGLARAFAGDIVTTADFFGVSVKRQLDLMLPPPPEPGTMQTYIGFLPRAWYRKPQFHFLKTSGLMEMDLLLYLHLMHDYILAARHPMLEQLAIAKDIDKKMVKFPNFCVVSRWVSCGGSGMSAFIVKDLAAIASLRCCRTSVALERCRLATGSLPNRLDDLVPQFLAAALTDPFDGQPLRYKKLTKGYVVYSVGDDGKDDGGDEKKDITFIVER